jgi:hypothetical protein
MVCSHASRSMVYNHAMCGVKKSSAPHLTFSSTVMHGWLYTSTPLPISRTNACVSARLHTSGLCSISLAWMHVHMRLLLLLYHIRMVCRGIIIIIMLPIKP